MSDGNKNKGRTTPAAVSPPPSSASASTSGTDWSILPPEVVEKFILTKLEKRDLFKCRLVSSTMKGIADYVLEQRALTEWTKWVPTEPRSDIDEEEYESWAGQYLKWEGGAYDPTCPIWNRAIEVKAIQLYPFPSRYSFSSEHVISFKHYLLDSKNDKLGTPFPNNFLGLRFHDQVWIEESMMPRRVELLKTLVVSYDYCFSYLSSLLITYIQITPGDVATILGHLGNLKALALEKIELLSEESVQEGENLVLPPLPKLSWLRVISAYDRGATKLLLNDYHQQIICLETDWAPVFPTPYKNLLCLKLITDTKPDFQFDGAEIYFPSLNHLSVIIHKGYSTFSLSELSKEIDIFPKKLLTLHLDVMIKEKSSDEEVYKLKPTGVTFPDLKNLGIFLPTTHQHADCLRRVILPKFKKLESLTFDSYIYNQAELDRHWPLQITEEERAARVEEATAARDEEAKVQRAVQEIEYWAQICPHIKKIHINGLYEAELNT